MFVSSGDRMPPCEVPVIVTLLSPSSVSGPLVKMGRVVGKGPYPVRAEIECGFRCRDQFF